MMPLLVDMESSLAVDMSIYSSSHNLIALICKKGRNFCSQFPSSRRNKQIYISMLFYCTNTAVQCRIHMVTLTMIVLIMPWTLNTKDPFRSAVYIAAG